MQVPLPKPNSLTSLTLIKEILLINKCGKKIIVSVQEPEFSLLFITNIDIFVILGIAFRSEGPKVH